MKIQHANIKKKKIRKEKTINKINSNKNSELNVTIPL